MQKFINPRLYMATVEYVKTMGTSTDAYDKLIVLLDEKFKTIDDVMDAANAAALVAV
jgi:3-hydroxyacyl-CoA dehydrogenase